MTSARTIIEPGGIPFFEGAVAPAGNLEPGFGGSGSGLIDIRWSDKLGGIEATDDGANWELKIPFEAFDA